MCAITEHDLTAALSRDRAANHENDHSEAALFPQEEGT